MGRDARDSKKSLQQETLEQQVKAFQVTVETDTKTNTAFTGRGRHCLLSLPLLDIYLVILSQEWQILYHLKWGA